jgi:hypothetical protein
MLLNFFRMLVLCFSGRLGSGGPHAAEFYMALSGNLYKSSKHENGGH